MIVSHIGANVDLLVSTDHWLLITKVEAQHGDNVQIVMQRSGSCMPLELVQL